MIKAKKLPELVIQEHPMHVNWWLGILACVLFFLAQGLLAGFDERVIAKDGLEKRDRELAKMRAEPKVVIHPEGWSCSVANMSDEYHSLIAKQCRDLAITIQAAKRENSK